MTLSLRDALRCARELGCEVANVNCTGEVRVRHPRMVKPLTIRTVGRRKDAPRVLEKILRRLRAARIPSHVGSGFFVR